MPQSFNICRTKSTCLQLRLVDWTIFKSANIENQLIFWHSTLSWLTALYSWTKKSPNRSSTPGSCCVGFPELEASRQWLEPGLKQSQNGICERVSEWVWCSALQCSAVWHHPKPNNFPEILTIWKEKMNLNRNWLTAARRTHATYHGFEARS